MKLSLDEQLQQLRSKATELVLREDWQEYINLYSHLISLCRHHLLSGSDDVASGSLQRTLCLAHSNRAEALFRTRDLSGALHDCDSALDLDPAHVKSLLCKTRVLLDLHRYSPASDCLKLALAGQTTGTAAAEAARELLERCRKLEAQSRSGKLDISDWVLNGFSEKCPDLAEYVGPVEIRRSDNGGRGLFATKSLEAGTPLVVTRAVAIERGILPESGDVHGESARMVMWKDFVDMILKIADKCSRTLYLIYQLSTGTEQSEPQIPDAGLFKPDAADELFDRESKELDIDRILKILDVNCLTEEEFSSKIQGKQNNYYGVGLWLLPSFVNHSCAPNARRLHIGDRVVIHASRDVKAGEEITYAYFDVLSPLDNRRKMAKRWGFECGCERCKFEVASCFSQEMRDLEMAMKGGANIEGVVVRLEEGLRKWMVKRKEKGFLRASLWQAYSSVYESERLMRRCGRRIPAAAAVAESGLLDSEKHFAFYGAYHSNPTNVFIHALFVWPIFYTSLILFHFTTPLLNLPSWLGGDVLVLNLGFVFAAIFGLFYVFMDRKAGSLAAVLCILCWIGSAHLARRLGFSLAWKVC
ncbi:hypothetical protein Cni_G11395 [Canna indica]|uniref:SET domain-containing protein n=1 Tax=Canna indica TaxID=4628 RepID=A0AAQ3Q860_9LILI|nr:hypothetical protein Cni_G11395 [Canna indica]